MKDLKKYTATVALSMDDLFAEMMRDASYKEMVAVEHSKLACAASLLEAREDAGLSQQALANKSGVPKTTIARIEKGNNTSIETLTKLANALGKHVIVSIV